MEKKKKINSLKIKKSKKRVKRIKKYVEYYKAAFIFSAAFALSYYLIEKSIAVWFKDVFVNYKYIFVGFSTLSVTALISSVCLWVLESKDLDDELINQWTIKKSIKKNQK